MRTRPDLIAYQVLRTRRHAHQIPYALGPKPTRDILFFFLSLLPNMISSTTHRWLTIAVLAGCSAFGAYATLSTASKNGLLAAISKAVGSQVKPKSRHFPGGPAPYKLSYTGIARIDDSLLTLISFFTLILDGPKTLDLVWVSRYLMTQFLAGWVLISLEGLRQGNKGRIVSW